MYIYYFCVYLYLGLSVSVSVPRDQVRVRLEAGLTHSCAGTDARACDHEPCNWRRQPKLSFSAVSGKVPPVRSRLQARRNRVLS